MPTEPQQQPTVIEGLVLSRESHLPVRHVLVVAYDVDPREQEQLTNALAEGSGIPARMQFWSSLAWDRLGSVITDDRGRFSLTFQDDLFARRDETEQRPDLVLFVMAPEDSFEGQPVSQHPLQRLLHYSWPMRTGSGRRESWIIRIPDERLRQFEIPVGVDGQGSLAGVQQLKRTLVDAETAESERKRQIDPLLAPARAEAAALSNQGNELARRLSLAPRAFAPEFFGQGLEEAQEQQATAIDQALDRVRLTPPFVLKLSPDDMARIGLESAGDVDSTTAGEVVRNRPARTGITRVRTLREACLASHHSPPSPEPTDPERGDASGGDDGAPEPVTISEAQQVVLSRTASQLAELHPYDPEAIGQRADPLALREKLDSLELRGGPADVTSYHDFHSLQLAFRSVWSRAFDDVLEADGAELYEHWVKTREFAGLGAPSTELLDEINDYRDLVRRVERDLSAAAGLSQRKGVIPDWSGAPSDVGGLGFMGLPGKMIGDSLSKVFGGGAGPASGVPGSFGAPPGTPRQIAEMFRSFWPGVERRSRGKGVSAPGAAAGGGWDDSHLLGRLGRLTEDVAARLSETYAFDVFAANTFNFGLLVTYRQRWQPETYQVGELVATIPLAPGEKRSVQIKKTTKRTRSEKEVENALASQRNESQQTSRADAEIVRKASMRTNFSNSTEGSFSFGEMARLTNTTQFGMNQARESEERKRNFREAVRKATQEFKQERTVEVQATEEQTLERTETQELSNPNNEISVTYLFYELQRRFKVSEQIHRARPVILVAQDVPRPDQIDEGWLLAHEWVLRRVLLDDELKAALDYIRQGMAGDELGVELLRATWQRNLRVVELISAQLDRRSALRDQLRDRVVELTQEVAKDETGQDVATAIFTGGLSLMFGGGGDDSGERLEAAREAADRELEFSDSEFAEAESRLKQAMSALEASTEKYVKALRAQANQRMAVDQLRIHVKQNILYYMQAIWSHEPSDQRYFRLYDLEIPWFELESGATLRVEPAPTPSAPSTLTGPLLRVLADRPIFNLTIDPTSLRPAAESKRLADVADIDNLLGFKGNYMMFPVLESNPLTEYLMADYREDEALGLIDPDLFANFTNEELADYLECLREVPEATPEEIDAVSRLLDERRRSGRADQETVVVPTGQLYIEALPGAHPVLEDFKLLHRAMDVKKVEAEVRGLELENLRRGARVVADDLSDPDIEKVVHVKGDHDAVIDGE